MIREMREKLSREIDQLSHELNVLLPQAIAQAVELGDLRENSEYKAALERQQFVQARLGQLHQRLNQLGQLANHEAPTDRVGLGSSVTVLDLVFVSKGADGTVRAVEIQEDADDAFGFGVVDLDVTGLTSSDDLDAVGEMLEPGTSAAVIVVEHTWARGFASAVMGAGGRVLMNERIPATVVNEAAAAVSIQD